MKGELWFPNIETEGCMNMRRFLLLILCLALVLAVAGCSVVPDNEQIRADTEAMLNAIAAGDAEAGYALIRNGGSKTQFTSFMYEVRSQCGVLDEYTLTPVNIQAKMNNGVTLTEVVYQMDTDRGRFLVTSVASSAYDGLVGFHINPDTTVHATGTPTTMAGADMAQWLMLAVWVAELGFMVWMVVDCARKKMKHKWLCLIAVWAVQIMPSVRMGEGMLKVNVNFLVNLIPAATSLVRYTNGETVFQLMIPLGALIYFFRRKKLTSPTPEPTAETAEDTANPIPEATET